MMYLVIYELVNASHLYEDLYSKLKNYDSVHPMETAWLISSEETAQEIYKDLEAALEEEDSLIVTELPHENIQGQIKREYVKWLKKS